MKKVLAAVAAVVVIVVAGVVTWVVVGGEDETVERGVCGPVTSWELSAEDEDGVTEVSLELVSSAPGETWTVLAEQGDQALYEGERETDEDAELGLDVRAETDGADEFTVTATPAEGEACVATLTR